MAKRWASFAVGVLAFTVLSTTAAMAGSTPEDIYNDYAANGRLTQEYSDTELLAYLGDTSFAEYGDADLQKTLVASVKDRIDRGKYPSTGFQIALIAIAVVVLVAGGVLLRYFSRPRKNHKNRRRSKGGEPAQDEPQNEAPRDEKRQGEERQGEDPQDKG